MVTVAITGAGGLIGRRLIAVLQDEPSVERIVGIDLVPPRELDGGKLVLRSGDVRDPAVADHLADVDVLVHLAFQLDPLHDERRMRAVNVEGTRNVLERAHAAGVRKVVYVSSGVVYGAHPDNDFPLTEGSPLRANAPFNYAEHKLEVERWLWPWAEARPELVTTVLRPSIVAGPGVDNFISRQLEAPRFTAVKGHKPPMQFAHVDDVAAALAHAVVHDLPGAFNVASEGWLSFDEVTAIGRRRLLEVPEEVAISLADRLWQLGVGHAPAGQVHYLMHPWVMSVDELRATGWQPRYSNRDALAELVEEHADHLTLGPLRTTRSRVRRVAVVLVIGGVVTAGILRHRRRHRRTAADR